MVVVVGGVTQVVVEVEDQDRAKRFWTEQLGFELVQDAPYGQERWLEVRTPDKAVTLVLGLRQGERLTAPDASLPTSNVMFYAQDLQQTYTELTARGVVFSQPPVRQPFGWWSLFQDQEGNRFALVPREQ
jgi:lactoylglutathione lyase